MSRQPTGSPGPPDALRLLIGAHVCLGVSLLVAPGRFLGELSRERIDTQVRVFARVLGCRHLAEAAVLAHRRTHDRILAGAAVDAIHGLTMIILASRRPGRRGLALANAALAAMFAACTVRYDRRESTALDHSA